MSEHEPVTYTGRCSLAMVNGLDTYGYLTRVEWDGDRVTITRTSSGGKAPVVTTERDTVTEDALLNLIVPGVAPAPDFQMTVVGTDMRDGRRAMLEIVAIEGEATVHRCHADRRAVALPAWFLRLLYELVLDDPDA
jgi:hypothetical protein